MCALIHLSCAVHDDIVEKLKEMDLPSAPKGNAGQGGVRLPLLVIMPACIVLLPVDNHMVIHLLPARMALVHPACRWP